MKFLPLVWPLSRSLATTYEISVDFSSSPYLDVSVQAVPLLYLLIQYRMHRQTLCGLLHSDICGSMLAYSSPQLFAVNHVFLRLPMPRHSPCALLRFTIRSWFIFAFSQLFVVSFTRLSEFLLLVVSSYLLVVSSFAFCFQLFFFSSCFLLFCSLKNRYQKIIPYLLISILNQKLFFFPSKQVVGTNGLEPSTSRLSGVRSNHLSYAPVWWR